MDFKELLADNVALLQRLQELGPSHQANHPLLTSSRLREIQDPLSWVSCFLGFLATKVDCSETRELAAYGQIIVHLARKHGGKGWLSYDRLFRQQKSAGSEMLWAELNPSLMAATVLGNGGEQGRVCSLCMASDHSASECALALAEHNAKPQTPIRPTAATSKSYRPQRNHPYPYNYNSNTGTRPPAYGDRDEPCRRFNRGFCNIFPCKFEHCCNACNRGPHPAIECPTRGSANRARQHPMAETPASTRSQ